MSNRDADRPSLQIPGNPLSELPWSADFVMQAIELLPVLLVGGELVALKPDCADSFIVGWPAGARPEDIASKAIEALGMHAVILHSTSWRHSGSDVVLTYLVVVPKEAKLPESWELAPIAHAELARGDATTPPPIIGVDQVLEHALRHLCWLVREDEHVGAALPGWEQVLEGYVPEPFRALGGLPKYVASPRCATRDAEPRRRTGPWRSSARSPSPSRTAGCGRARLRP